MSGENRRLYGLPSRVKKSARPAVSASLRLNMAPAS